MGGQDSRGGGVGVRALRGHQDGAPLHPTRIASDSNASASLSSASFIAASLMLKEDTMTLWTGNLNGFELPKRPPTAPQRKPC